MRTILRGAFALALSAAVVAPVELSAQAPVARPIRFGATAGLTLPLGDFGDAADAGFHVGGLLDFKFAGSPVGLRVDGQWHRNGLKDFEGINIDGNADILFGAASLVFEPTTNAASSLAPYVLGGVGVYRVKLTGDDFEGIDDDERSETKAGFNVGGGLKFKLSGFDTFLEARYHYINSSEGSTSFIPISFGIVF